MRILKKSLLCQMAVVLFLVTTAKSQVATGTYPFGTFDNKGFDSINVANLNVHFNIPIFSKTGRGNLGFSYGLVYDSSIWTPSTTSGTLTWEPATQWGWTNSTSGPAGLLDLNKESYNCDDAGGNVYHEDSFYYVDAGGQVHIFPGSISECDTDPDYGPSTVPAADNSGLVLNINGIDSFVITDQTGKTISPATTLTNAAASVTDNNGNMITVSPSGTVTDTTGTSVLTVTGNGVAGSPTVYTYPVWLNPTSSTTSASVTVHYSLYNVATSFGCSGIREFSQNGVSLVDSVRLADGETYSFTYEPTPGSSATTTGRLQTVTLPTQGVITYAYSGGSNGIVCGDGSAAGLQRSTTAPTANWVYARTPGSTESTTHTDVTSPMGDHATFDFIADIADDPSYSYFPVQHSQYHGAASGIPLLQEATCYVMPGVPVPGRRFVPNICSSTSLLWPVSAANTTSTYNGVSTKLSTISLDSSGNVIDSASYDYGASSSYQSLTQYGADYDKPNIASPGDVTVNGITTWFDYDEMYRPFTVTSGLPQHVAVNVGPYGGYGPSGRGNLSAVWATGSGPISTLVQTAFGNDDAGQVRQVIDTAGNTTTYSYDSTDTFLSQVTYPTIGSVTQTVQYNYDVASGVLKSFTDQNNNTTSYTYDNMLRLVSTSYPDGGYVTNTYSLTASTPTVSSSVQHSTGSIITATVSLDPYGRPSRTDSTDSPNDDLVDTSYDVDGNVYKVSNPYRAGDTPIYTYYFYDALGRNTSIQETDGSTASSLFNGNTVVTTDEANHQRKFVYDGAGRLSTVFEPDSNGNFTIETDYTYSGTQIASITQKGGSTSPSDWRTRTYTYDGVGRMISQTIAESGTTTYTYPDVGTFCAGDINAPCKRTDANGTITTYSYDALNRLTGKSYSGSTIAASTPSVLYYYDQYSFNGLSIANPLGQRTGMSDASGLTAWTFDKMGRPTATRKSINGVLGQASYGYNPDGSLNTLQDYSGTSFTYTYDATGRPTGVADSNGRSYASNASYNAASELTGLTQQLTSSAATFSRIFGYNSRLQPQTIQAQAGTTPIQSLSYTYGAAAKNNGNISSIANGMDATHQRDQSYTYDNMNRLYTGQDGTHWGEVYGYDNWGNMLTKTATRGSTIQFSVTAGSNNQLSNLMYDAAGEVTTDQFGTNFTYDAEGRILTAGGGSYVYDGDGYRVEKTVGSTTTLYWPSAVSGITDESNASATSWGRQVGLGGLQLWSEDTAGNGKFLFQDHLGSTRITADASGNVKDDIDYTPYGILTANYGPGSDIHYQFTGTETDTESSTTYNTFRNLSVSLGRFGRPDPYDGSYDLTNPQSLNRYTYVLSSPMAFTDSLGLSIFPVLGGEPWCFLLHINCSVVNPDPTSGQDGGDPGPGGGDQGPYVSAWDGFRGGNFSFTNVSYTYSGGGFGAGGAPNNPCNVQPATSFVQAHQADAATLANQLHVPTNFILAVAGAESTYGTSRFATQANNYFGMHAGAFGSTGPFAGNPIVAAFPAGNGFLISGESFVHTAGPLLAPLSNPSDPTQFFTALHQKWGVGTPNYVSTMVGNASMAAIRMTCP